MLRPPASPCEAWRTGKAKRAGESGNPVPCLFLDSLPFFCYPLFMTEESKTYQMTLFLPVSLGETEAKETIKKILQMVEQKGGEIKKSPVFEISVAEGKSERISLDKFKKELAYPIKKNRVVFCFNVDFALNEELMADFQNQLKLEKAVIRHMVTAKSSAAKTSESISNAKLDEKIKSLIDQEIPLPEKPTERMAEPELTPENPPFSGQSKSKIENLDKKLEEILNQ
jgi:ribosomal protein S6